MNNKICQNKNENILAYMVQVWEKKLQGVLQWTVTVVHNNSAKSKSLRPVIA